MAARCYRAEPGGLLLFVRATPNAGADRLSGTETRDDGSTILPVHVRAVPERGKANAALIAMLARALGVPKSAMVLVSGETSRSKTLRIAGDPVALATALDALIAAAPARKPRTS